MSNEAKNVLVLGGAGYIGSHTCKELASRGFRPIVYDNFSQGHRDAVKWGPMIEGDILNKELLVETLIKIQPLAIIHFAGSLFVGESVTKPSLYYKNNIEGSIAVLEAMRETNISKIVFSSTAAVYGLPELQPIAEVSVTDPINPYGRTKLAVEWALRDYGSAYQINSVCLRYFNASGADADGEAGERHDPETHIVPLTIQAALTGKPIRLFGSDYPTRDGTCVRDYIHVTDLAKGHVAALSYLLEGGKSDVFNLGTGKGTSVQDIIDAVRQISNMPITVLKQGRRDGDPPELVADVRKSVEILNFVPEHSSLNNIVKTAFDFHVNNPSTSG